MTDSRRTETTSLWSGEPARAPIGLLAPGTRLAERYEIRAVLGHGGFAVVYLAHDRELGRDVALKVLREDRLTPGSLTRLKREVRVARDLAHPNLVRVFDIETAGSALFVSLEAIHGGSLRDQLKKGPMPVEVALRLATGLLRGLQALHGVGIVHRDIKPANVLLTDEGEVKLADFGLALHLEGSDTRVTATETAVGTLEYLAPEQALGEEVDPRTDLYSAGVVLFEMLTGRLPHEGKSSLGNLIARFREQPPDLAALRPETPRWLARLVARLLARDRLERYPSAAAVLHDLERRRAATGPSRQRRFAAGAIALLIVAIGAAIVALVSIRSHGFSHVITEGVEGVVAVDRGGRVLWRREGVLARNNYLPFRPSAGAPLRLAAIEVGDTETAFDRVLDLALLDPASGTVLDHLKLVADAPFSEFPRNFAFRLHVLDLDGDGGDEILIDYGHRPWWPYFAILVEPSRRLSRTVFAASGHHYFQGSADIDGDGRAELLFAGVNNRLGWRSAVAAVRVDPWIGAPVSGVPAPVAITPDLALGQGSLRGLDWYWLGPRRTVDPRIPALTPDSTGTALALRYADGSTERLSLAGFSEASDSSRSEPERSDSRHAAWREVYQILRRLEGERPREALPLLDNGLASAERADDLHLASWFRQTRLVALAQAGRDTEVDAGFEAALAGEPESASELAYQLARAWHRRGRLDRAIASYRRAETLPGATPGRGPFELLQGVVLTLVEAGDFEGALAEARRAEAVFVDGRTHSEGFEEFVRWRMGELPDPARLPTDTSSPDLFAYWYLEAKLARGTDPAEILDTVAIESQRRKDIGPLLDSVRSEALWRLGRLDEAREAARRALSDLDRGLPQQLSWRVHRPILAERLARIGSRQG